jgi:hypothetical protein
MSETEEVDLKSWGIEMIILLCMILLVLFFTRGERAREKEELRMSKLIGKEGLETVGTILSIEEQVKKKEDRVYYTYKVDSLEFKSLHMGYMVAPSVKVGEKFVVKYLKENPKENRIYFHKKVE